MEIKGNFQGMLLTTAEKKRQKLVEIDENIKVGTRLNEKDCIRLYDPLAVIFCGNVEEKS